MRKVFYILLVAIIITGVAVTPASALTVSPARIEITGDPGATVGGEIELFNEQEGVRMFYSSSENFESSGDTGAPYFVGAKDGLATWIKTQESVSLQSGERIKIPYTIVIPKEAAPGGYFAAVFFGSQPPVSDAGGEVSIGGKIGVLVLLRVTGEVKEGGGLKEFQTNGGKRFFSSTPISFSYSINNDGGDRIVPQGEMKIKNMLWLTSAKLFANKGDGSVLPNSTRKFEVVWEEGSAVTARVDGVNPGFFSMAKKQLADFHFGLYTAKLDLFWGATNLTASDSHIFFIVPWQLLSIMMLILALLAFVGRIGLKKYNKYIIAQVTRNRNE